MYIDSESFFDYPHESMYEDLNILGLVLWYIVMLTFEGIKVYFNYDVVHVATALG